MEDRVNKPKRKKCPGTGQMSVTVDRGVFGIDHNCPVCGGRIEVTNKNYKEPRPIRLHMVNVKTETPPNTGLQADGAYICPQCKTLTDDFMCGRCMVVTLPRPAAKA